MSTEYKPQWDWQVKWPKCRFYECNKDAYYEDNEPLLIDNFHFCEDHYRFLRNERELILFDAMNPKRIINENCINKEWHYKNLCTLGSFGECNCIDCGSPMQHCLCERCEK